MKTYPVGKKVYASFTKDITYDMIDVPCVISKVHEKPHLGEQGYDVTFMDGSVTVLSEWHLSEYREASAAYQFMVGGGWRDEDLPSR